MTTFSLMILWLIGQKVLIVQFTNQHLKRTTAYDVKECFFIISTIIWLCSNGDSIPILLLWLLEMSVEDAFNMEISYATLFGLAITAMNCLATNKAFDVLIVVFIWLLLYRLHHHFEQYFGDGDIDVLMLLLLTITKSEWWKYLQILSILSLLVLLPLLALGIVNRRDRIPVIPFMTIAYLVLKGVGL